MVLHRNTAGCNITVHLCINCGYLGFVSFSPKWTTLQWVSSHRAAHTHMPGRVFPEHKQLGVRLGWWDMRRVRFTRRSRCFPKRIYYSHSYQPWTRVPVTLYPWQHLPILTCPKGLEFATYSLTANEMDHLSICIFSNGESSFGKCLFIVSFAHVSFGVFLSFSHLLLGLLLFFFFFLVCSGYKSFVNYMCYSNFFQYMKYKFFILM